MTKPMQKYFNEKNDLFWLMLFFSLFYLVFIGTHPFFVPDEGRYAEIAREMLSSKDFITPHLNGYLYFEKPPLFYWLSSLSLAVVGEKEWALRLPNALLAIAGLSFTFLTAKTLFNRRAAWFASIILGTSFLYFSTAHYINVDMAVSVLMMGCLYCFIIDAVFGLYICAAFAVLAKGLIGIVLPGAVIVAWLLMTGSLAKFKRFISVPGIILFLIIVLPWHVLAQLKNPGFFDFYIIEQHFIRYLHGTDHLRTPKWVLLSFLVLGLFPWFFLALIAFFKICKDALKKKTSKVMLFFILWIIIIYSFFQLSYTVLVGYVLPILPAFAILLGKYLDEQCYLETATKWHRLAWILNGILAVTMAAALGYFSFLQEQVSLFSFLGAQLSSLIISLILLGIVPLYFSFQRNLQKSIISVILFAVICLAQIIMIASFFNDKTGKDIAEKIKQDYPNARVVVDIYMQDLPFYLGKTLEASKFPRELDFGVEQENNPLYLIPRETVFKLWKQDKNLIFVIKKEDLEEVKAELKHYHVAYASKRYLVLSHD